MLHLHPDHALTYFDAVKGYYETPYLDKETMRYYLTDDDQGETIFRRWMTNKEVSNMFLLAIAKEEEMALDAKEQADALRLQKNAKARAVRKAKTAK